MKKKLLSVLLCITMIASLLIGCSAKKDTGNNGAATNDTNGIGSNDAVPTGGTDTSTGSSKYKNFITVDVYDGQANYMGIETGWFANIVKQKFNMELNIISPNVAGGGDTAFQARSAAGNLGDLIISTAAGGKLQDLVDANLVLDLSDYLKNEPNLNTYMDAITYTNQAMSKTAGLWCVPSEVSTRSADTMLGGTNPNTGDFLRWDLYKQLGKPELNSLEDILPILKQMQDLAPTSDSGKKTYGFSLWPDWDGDYMQNATWLMANYGYGTLGFAICSADDSLPPQSAIDSDSYYIKGLKFLFDANQMGLVDPDSATQNYDTVSAKYKDGAVLFTPFPWLGQAAYNTETHTSAGKGFEFVPFNGEKIYGWGCYSKGNPNNAIMVGSKAQDPQRMVDFIDWLYSPEGISLSTGQTSGSCGPEGLTWEMQNNQPVLTDFGKQAYLSGDPDMPAEYGGGKWSDGVSQLNYKTVSDGEINPETGFPYNIQLWDSIQSSNINQVDQDWQQSFGAKNPVEYLLSKNQMLISPGSGYATPSESSDITAIRSQCKATIVDDSWKAVFAANEDEFNSLVKDMQDTCIGLGYNDVLAVDMQNVADQKALREKVLN